MTEAIYLDDLQPGISFGSGSLFVDADMIRRFAVEYDPQPFHLDDAAAQDTLFHGLAASGWHTAALTMRLLVDGGLPIAGGIVGAGMDEVRWPKPVRPGDTLHLRSEVLEVRPSKSRPDRGLAKIRVTTLNARQEAVQVLVANLVVPRRPKADQPTEAWMAALERRRISTALGEVNVWLGGNADGAAMVFWPSLLVDSAMWRFQYDHYAPTHRVVLVDPPGAGMSEPLHRLFSLTQCGDCLIAVLDALGIARCHLVGTSWGALVASVFAAHHPERLRSAVLINGSATPPAAGEVASMTELVTALDSLTAMPEWLVGATQAAFAGATAEASKPEFMAYLRRVLNQDPLSVAMAIRSEVIQSMDRHSLLQTIKDVPILVLAGEEGRHFSVAESSAMADAILVSRFAVLPLTGHLAARESPAAVNGEIDAFLARNAA